MSRNAFADDFENYATVLHSCLKPAMLLYERHANFGSE